MIAMYIASQGSPYGHRDVWPIKAQRPYSVLTEITAIQLKTRGDRHSQIHIVVFERLPQFKNIFAQSFRHSSNVLICRIYIVDQSCSPKAYRQPSTGRLQSFSMIGMKFTRALKQITKQNICWLFCLDFPLHQAGRNVCLWRTGGFANVQYSTLSTFNILLVLLILIVFSNKKI